MSEINPSPVFDHPDRHVGFRGAFNFRDLGGYRGHGGKSVKWRTLFRADALHRLDEVELDELAALGMRSVLDLRTATEVDHGRIKADHLGILHLHFPVLGQAWEPRDLDPDADAGDVLGSLYIEMLAIGAPALANSLRTIASAESLPAVFHCAAGKDRTGVLAAMVLSLVGVDEETIMGDYLLSGIAMDSLVERLKRDSPESLTAMNDQPSAYLAAPREAMAMFLAHVNSTYGSMTHYVNHIGIESDVIDSLQANLLD